MAGKKRIVIDFNKVYKSNSCGDFMIIEDLGRDQGSRLYVKIKFLETGTEKVVRYDIAMAGKVIDDLYGIDFNTVFDSMYYGKFKIIAFVNRNHESKKIVRIKFLNTGYEYNVNLKQVKIGTVRDYSVDYQNKTFNPSIDNHDIFISTILHARWKAMISRCYNPNDDMYSEYGALGVTVCDLWRNVDNYINTVKFVKNYNKFYINPYKYQIDKDFLQQNVPKGERVYSPDTCMFLSIIDNANLSMKEKHIDGSLYGVRVVGTDRFQIIFSINGKKYNFGTYSNLIAAANEYNYYYSIYSDYEYVPLFNENIPFMTREEARKYLITWQMQN